ncbi:MAG: hypothetical protein NVS4B3_23220 [Gemmatimonadaceae bacterium]
MRIVLYHAARAWSGRTRALATIARVLAQRGCDVTFVCASEGAGEERLRRDLFRVLPLDLDGDWPLVAWRFRAVLRGAHVILHEGSEALVASVAIRLGADSGHVVLRVSAGERLPSGRGASVGARLVPTTHLYTMDADRAAAGVEGKSPLAELGVDVAGHDAARPVARVSIGAGSSTRLIVCVCGAGERSRVANVLRTLALLAPRHPELRLVLVGPGSDDDNLRMHAAALGLARLVGHLGDRDDHLSVLAAADVGWVAASGDDAAFALLDLMALRIPVLAERTPVAARYVADGITGILLPRSEAAAMAAAIAPFLANEEARTAMGNAGRTRVAREFTETQFVDAVAAALAQGTRGPA